MQTRTNGSNGHESTDRITIGIRDETDRERYECPGGHTDWTPCESGVWCHSCARDLPHNDDVSPEHDRLVDALTGTEIPWSDIEVIYS